MLKGKISWYWVLDGSFAISLLIDHGISYKTRETKQPSGIEIGISEESDLIARDLFTAANINYNILK